MCIRDSFYPIGILWILFYDFLCEIKKDKKITLKSLLIHHKRILIISCFALGLIFFFTFASNCAQWKRSYYERIWFSHKRDVLLNPTEANLDDLLWSPQASLQAIHILKTHKLSVYRDPPENTVEKMIGWGYIDGWIGKSATVKATAGQKGIFLMNISLTKEILHNIYEDNLVMTITVNGQLYEVFQLDPQFLIEGSRTIALNIQPGKTSIIQIDLNKSFVPIEHMMGRDKRELGIKVQNLSVQ